MTIVAPDVVSFTRSPTTRRLPARLGDAGAYQRLVSDNAEVKAYQDRREGRHSRPLCRVPDGRGCEFQERVRRHPADDRGTATAAGRVNGVARSIAAVPMKRRERCVSPKRANAQTTPESTRRRRLLVKIRKEGQICPWRRHTASVRKEMIRAEK